MSTLTSTICLNMIVKNEAHVIARCLDSVRPFVDQWIIVDTGSTDATPDRIRTLYFDLPGELHERPWRNFEHNRNEALSLAQEKADYILFIDADERLELPADFERHPLSADGYYLCCEFAGTSYSRCALVATRLPWRWKGVIHEFLECDEPVQLDRLNGPTIVIAHDGARSRDPQTYSNDAVLLEEALRNDPDNGRYAFYLAQSYRDAGRLKQSREAYRRRAAMTGFEEETWYSLYQIAKLDEALRAAPFVVQSAYLQAFTRRPTRAEPLCQLARFWRQRQHHGLAYEFARNAASIPRPPDLLFVEDAVYRWIALDELAIAAYYANARDEGRTAIYRLLAENQFPESERARILRNKHFYDTT